MAEHPSDHNPTSTGHKTQGGGDLRKRPGGPCAACKFKRRRCPPDCPLAPYFPSSNMGQFLNAHRLFGVSNMAKSLTAASLEERDDAANAIIYAANARARDPVGGCYGIICELVRRKQRLEEELSLVVQLTAFLRSIKVS